MSSALSIPELKTVTNASNWISSAADAVAHSSGHMITVACGITVVGLAYLSGGFFALAPAMITATVLVRNRNDILQYTFGQPRQATNQLVADLTLLENATHVTGTQLINNVADQLSLSLQSDWDYPSEHQTAKTLIPLLRTLTLAQHSSTHSTYPDDNTHQLNKTHQLIRVVMKSAIAHQRGQFGIFRGGGFSSTAVIDKQQAALQYFINNDPNYMYDATALQTVANNIQVLLGDPSQLIGTVSLFGRLFGNSAWPNSRHPEQYFTLQAAIQQLLDNAPEQTQFALPSHLRTLFQMAITVGEEIRISQQSYPQQVLNTGIGILPKSAQRVVRAMQSAYSALVTTNAGQAFANNATAAERQVKPITLGAFMPNTHAATSANAVMNTSLAGVAAILNEFVGGSTTADESSGVLAMLNSIINGTGGTIAERIYAALSGSVNSGTMRLPLTILITVLKSEQLNRWIDGQNQHSREKESPLRTDIQNMTIFLEQVQAHPMETMKNLDTRALTELGVNGPNIITTDAQAIRLAFNHLRNLFSNHVILVNGFTMPFFNTAQPANDLTANQLGITRDLERLTLEERVTDTPETRTAQSRVLDKELSVQKEAFVKNATAFAAFQLVEWAIGSPNRQGAIDATIRAELRDRHLLESDSSYYSELEALRQKNNYYKLPDVFKDIMGKIDVTLLPKDQPSEFKRHYRKKIEKRTDLNWFQKKFAKVLLPFSIWGFDLVLKNSVSELTSFAYDRMHEVNGAVQINMTPIQGLKNFLMGIHRGNTEWVADTTDARTALQHPLLNRDQYMDWILRQKEFNQNYTADELNATLGDVLVDNFFPNLGWSNKISKIWNDGPSAWCQTASIDSSSSWAPMNLPLKGLKWILTSPLHLWLGILSLATKMVQGVAGVVFKCIAKKALRDTGLVSNILKSSRESLYENSPYNIAMNEIVLEQLKEVYKELRRTPEDAENTTRVRVANPSNAQLYEILGLIDNLFEVQRTVHYHTPTSLGKHLQNNRGGYFEQLTTDLRNALQGAYEPQVKEQIGRALMVVYESFLQPDQVKKQLAAILKASNNAMTDEIPKEQRGKAADRGAKVEEEIKGVRDSILRTIIDQAINEQVSQLGEREIRVATTLDRWMKAALVGRNTEQDDEVNELSAEAAPLIPQWRIDLDQYENANTDMEKWTALNQIKTSLYEYNTTLQTKLTDVRTNDLNAQTQGLLQTRAKNITQHLCTLVDHLVPLYKSQSIAGANQTNTTSTTQTMNHHVANAKIAIDNLYNHLTDKQRPPITFHNADLVSANSAIPEGIGKYIFSEMQQSTDRLLLMAKKGYLFEGAIRHAVILPVINQAGRSRISL